MSFILLNNRVISVVLFTYIKKNVSCKKYNSGGVFLTTKHLVEYHAKSEPESRLRYSTLGTTWKLVEL